MKAPTKLIMNSVVIPLVGGVAVVVKVGSATQQHSSRCLGAAERSGRDSASIEPSP
ncbi:MAG: hypothetical protein WA705_10265 [Candidatus Ozemobacteraceae bacterium]